MKTINLNTAEGIRFTLFPDNQPHVNIQGIEEGDEVKVICSLTDSAKVIQLLQTANALDNLFAVKKLLVIPYLMAARYDRLMQHGDSIDIKVIADLINSCGFAKVWLFDVHSEVSSLLIKNAVNISNRQMVEQYQLENAVLICPDAGAAKKVGKYFEWNKNLKDIVYCSKNRDLATGRLTLEVLEPGECENRNCVIIDDICDGGATFLAIAEKIKPAHLTLIVSHGIFSKGFAALEQKFNQVIVSDSFNKSYKSGIVKTIAAIPEP
ncbi:MAG: ribose-phosphate pyrophosphokinase [Chitinophagaceae bacterium]|nr:ribose-phosphate pyrophosphokinase [Chitinophagaceae bacterium]